MKPLSPLDISNRLQDALQKLRAGEHQPAHRILQEVLVAHPDLADAYWLLAGSYFQTNELANAQRALQSLIGLDVRRLDAYVLLSRIFAAEARFDDAIDILGRALSIDAGFLPALTLLSRLLLSRGRNDEACALLEPHTCKPDAGTELLMLHGHGLMATGQPKLAAEIFQRAAQNDPRNTDIQIRLAAALSDAGRNLEAESTARRAIAQGLDSPHAHFVLARALMGQHKLPEAESELRKTVRAQPDHLLAHTNLSEVIWMQTGDAEAACSELDTALRRYPQLVSLRISKANLLLTADLAEQALAEIEAGLAMDERDVQLRIAAARIAVLTNPAAAADYARSTLRDQPDNRAALVACGDALLASGDGREAATIAERLRKLDPDDGQAIALQAEAWRMLGDDRYRQLFDYTSFVRAYFLDTPSGWPDLQSYLDDLARGLRKLHTRDAHPVRQSLRHGSQIELDLQASQNRAIRAFGSAIDEPVRQYMRSLGRGADDMRRRNTGQYRLTGAWSVSLRTNGFHVNHYHPQGWLSSACYIELPPAMAAGRGEGWLQFGEPAAPTRPAQPVEYFLKPEAGLLALFPSYMWHGTVPFSGTNADTRLTIAFDALPVQQV